MMLWLPIIPRSPSCGNGTNSFNAGIIHSTEDALLLLYCLLLADSFLCFSRVNLVSTCNRSERAQSRILMASWSQIISLSRALYSQLAARVYSVPDSWFLSYMLKVDVLVNFEKFLELLHDHIVVLAIICGCVR